VHAQIGIHRNATRSLVNLAEVGILSHIPGRYDQDVATVRGVLTLGFSTRDIPPVPATDERSINEENPRRTTLAVAKCVNVKHERSKYKTN